ncbi:threonine synthase [Halocalculus aciditolerans]|uniref:Threonine synthase n=1 Tax=Halocalculus aciditolerans TaxID=1383812 RepID=A0A830FKM1_9EURY|nr:pyridoxal-phosphate dependent enzyme [Halocalculus aciditolerans]GGL61608.1 threonine synthase [Halocalculus aciditolerans]
METTTAFSGLSCVDCGETFDDPALGRCPECSGVLDAQYDLGSVALDDEGSMWAYEPVLPFAGSAAVSLGEGGTPLVEAPGLAEELGVNRVLIKDDGRNPTGTAVDRGLSLAVTPAGGESTVTLASTGDDAQSAAAYAARAGLPSESFVPTRAGFSRKAMVNVHGGEMSVVEGRLGDAVSAYRDAVEEHDDWHAVGAFDTPYRHEGLKTVLYEVVDDEFGVVPDAVIAPTGHGELLAGLGKAARELVDLGKAPSMPRLYAAQAEGCAPIVRALQEDHAVEPWDAPDTIAGAIEVPDPDPSGAQLAVDAVEDTGGAGVTATDGDILDAALAVAEGVGVEMGVSGAVAAAGAWNLADEGAFAADDTVVLLNTSQGNKDADVLRSRLMSRGI